jgi:hypothetical protein
MPWQLTGNSNTNPATNFLGTTDQQPLVIKTNGTEAIRVNVDGIPSSKLEIAAQDGLAVTGFQPFITLRDANAGNARSIIQGVGGDIVLIPNSFIGGGAALVAKTGSGDVIMNGNLTVAKDIILSGSDCAEQFDIVALDGTEPGAVMVVNAEGVLELCQKAYDKNVAGVISGAGEYKPGIIMDRRESDHARMPVALMGKAYCKVDANYGPIEVGDLLTTSDRPGHAMKAADILNAFGSTIGKALRSFKEGQGIIPILISLQ